MQAIARGRQTVFGVTAVDDENTDGLASGLKVAVRVANPLRSREFVEQEQELAMDWRSRGGKIVGPLHPDPVSTEIGLVGVWEWIENNYQPISARDWGKLLRNLHTTGMRVRHADWHSPTWLIDQKRFAIHRALRDRSHPLYGQSALVDAYESEVEAAFDTLDELRMHNWNDYVLVHGDYSPGNFMNTNRGPYAYDIEGAGVGLPAEDFDIAWVGLRRYGWNPQILSEMQSGYGARKQVPMEQIAVGGRLRELSSAGYSMMAAHLDQAHYLEFLKRVPIVRDPDAETEIWRHVGGLREVNTMEAGYRVVLERDLGRTDLHRDLTNTFGLVAQPSA